MRKLIYWLLLPLAVAVGACGGKKDLQIIRRHWR